MVDEVKSQTETKETENKNNDVFSKKFRVALNPKKQGFYSDGYIILTMNTPYADVDPKKHKNIELMKNNIELGFLNIIDENGNIIYSAQDIHNKPLAQTPEPDITTVKTKLDEEEEKFIKRILSASSSNVIRTINKIDKVYILDAIIKYEERSKKPRKGIILEAKKRKYTLTEKG